MKKALIITTALYLSLLSFAPSAFAAVEGGIPSGTLYSDPQGGFAPNYAATIVTPAVSSGGACGSLTTNGLNGVFSCLVGLMNNLVVLMIAGAVLYIVWGAFTMIRSEEKRDAGRQTVVYGIIGLFVMISVWGLVNILDRTFNLRGSYIAPPQITPNGR